MVEELPHQPIGLVWQRFSGSFLLLFFLLKSKSIKNQLKTQNTPNYFHIYVISQPKSKKYSKKFCQMNPILLTVWDLSLVDVFSPISSSSYFFYSSFIFLFPFAFLPSVGRQPLYQTIPQQVHFFCNNNAHNIST
jgi:hypothetical protein